MSQSMLACCHEDEARLRDPWQSHCISPWFQPRTPQIVSTRVGLLSPGSTTDGSISRTQHPTPARTVLLGPVSTPPVVSRTRAGDAECLGLVQSSLTQPLMKPFIALNISWFRRTRVSVCLWMLSMSGCPPRVTEWWCWRRHARLFLTPGAPPRPAPPRPLCPGGGYKGFRHRRSVIRGGAVWTQSKQSGADTRHLTDYRVSPHLRSVVWWLHPLLPILHEAYKGDIQIFGCVWCGGGQTCKQRWWLMTFGMDNGIKKVGSNNIKIEMLLHKTIKGS